MKLTLPLTRPGRGRFLGHALAALGMMTAVGAAQAATPANALVMAWNIDAISTFDPAQVGEAVTGELLRNICETLVGYDPDDETKLVPLLAESWQVSEDGQQITFRLRDNLHFSGGGRATAPDLAWSMQRVIKLGYGNSAQMTDFGFTKENVEQNITAPDDRTLILKLAKPYPVGLVLQSIAANRVSSLLDREKLLANQNNGDLGNRYLATRTECVGPYRLRQWNAGDSVVLEANEKYWGAAPKLRRVIIRHVAEAGTQRLLVEKGDVDIARNLTPEDLQALEKVANIRLARVVTPSIFYWGFNNAHPVLSNDKVRLAMRYLVDYDGLAKTVMAYNGIPRASLIQLGAFGALDEKEGQPFSLDLEKAKALLTEAGYPDGFEMTLYIGSAAFAAPIAQHVQQNAAKVGVRIRLEQMANAQLFARHRGREFESIMLGWQTGVSDAHGNASRHMSNPDNRPEAKLTQYLSWRHSFHSEEVNRRVQEALMERDEAKRAALYHALQRDMMQTGPSAVLFQTVEVAAVSRQVVDWKRHGLSSFYSLASKQ